MTGLAGKTHLQSRIHVSVDSRIELLSVMLQMSGYGARYPGRINDDPSPYHQDIERYFGRYSDHESIRQFRNLNLLFSGDLPVTVTLYLSQPPKLENRAPFDEMVCTRVKDDTVLSQYVAALRQFAMDTDFYIFFAAHREYYTSLIADHEKSIREGNYLQALENYYGWEQSAYFVIFAPLLKTVAFGPRVYKDNGDIETYCVFPAFDVAEDGRITFKTGKALQNRILHEFGHSFVNPLVEQRKAEIAPYARLMQSLTYNTLANYGNEWHISVYEHIVRAVTTRLTYEEYGAEAGEKELLAHEKQGFIYTRFLCKKMELYENMRETWPTFQDFFPELICVFDTLAKDIKQSDA